MVPLDDNTAKLFQIEMDRAIKKGGPVITGAICNFIESYAVSALAECNKDGTRGSQLVAIVAKIRGQELPNVLVRFDTAGELKAFLAACCEVGELVWPDVPDGD